MRNLWIYLIIFGLSAVLFQFLPLIAEDVKAANDDEENLLYTILLKAHLYSLFTGVISLLELYTIVEKYGFVHM